jgi:SAM-dependent methyltransferase
VLECGCGTGAQTVILAARNPGARIVAVDISAASLVEARARVTAAGHRNVEFRVANLFDLPFADEHFDHVFVCFLLEHVAQPDAARAVQCLVDVQARFGGDALIGRRLYPLLTEAGFRNVRVSPRMVYVDDSRPHLVEGFSKNTFIAMVEGVRDQALSMGMVDRRTWEKGIADLYRATEPGGTFCYTFFKATASQ